MLILEAIDPSSGRLLSERGCDSFPFSMGRSAENHWVIAEPGVWDRHARIELTGAGEFELVRCGEGSIHLNGEPVERSTRFKLTDEVRLGGIVLRAGLSPVCVGSGRSVSALVWCGLAGVALAQVALIYWLER